jgi:hypothetical protein
MHVYFSHSYRDAAINVYFLKHLIEADVPLVADQKSTTWCVAKLERYLFESRGFLSVIPRRASDQDPAGYSQYIGHELDLARRARVPRLLFVERQVFERHETRFPEDAVTFDPATPEVDSVRHRAAIAKFIEAARGTSPALASFRRKDDALLVSDDAAVLHSASDEVAELLRREGFSVARRVPNRRGRAIDDVRLLEQMWRAELCVFLLGERLSEGHQALAMAYAHCIPAVRLIQDKAATDTSPSLQGVIRWRDVTSMILEFKEQLRSFRRGFVEPVVMARTVSVEAVAARMATTDWQPTEEHLWDLGDGPGLLRHVATSDNMVQDEVQRARSGAKRVFGGQPGRERDREICRALYDGLKRHKYAYEIEPQMGLPAGRQRIRTPGLIAQSSAATCLDLACLFAALLEAAGLNAIILIVKFASLSHALAGYRSSGEPEWSQPLVGDARRACDLGDAVMFDPTGAVESSTPVTPEERDERREKLIVFEDATSLAGRIIHRPDVTLELLLDVRPQRA